VAVVNAHSPVLHALSIAQPTAPAPLLLTRTHSHHATSFVLCVSVLQDGGKGIVAIVTALRAHARDAAASQQACAALQAVAAQESLRKLVAAKAYTASTCLSPSLHSRLYL
jgi:hypothetical protein